MAWPCSILSKCSKQDVLKVKKAFAFHEVANLLFLFSKKLWRLRVILLIPYLSNFVPYSCNMFAFLQHVVFCFQLDFNMALQKLTQSAIFLITYFQILWSLRLQFSIQLCPLNTFTPWGFHFVVIARVEWQTTWHMCKNIYWPPSLDHWQLTINSKIYALEKY
jgi:hypothetical protein